MKSWPNPFDALRRALALLAAVFLLAAPLAQASNIVTSLSDLAGNTVCAVVSGGVQCWGDNTYGVLRNNGTKNSAVPVATIASGSGVTSVSVDSAHACMVVNGGVQCWGRNDHGQLGNNSTTDSLIPVTAIAAGSGATAVSVGSFHSCAVINGGVQCWGFNQNGELGNNSTTTSLTPVIAIAPGSGATSVSVSNFKTCAVVNGGVQCWGSNQNGALGNNSTTDSLVPVTAIAAGSGATSVSGNGATCAVVNGGVKCWGYNGSGQFGNNSTTSSLVPVIAIAAGSGATSVTTGPANTCAVVNGGVKCWGDNNRGDLGNNSTTPSLIPVTAIPPGSGVTAVSSGGSNACALVSGGVQCWGINFAGQLGNSSTTDSLIPVAVTFPAPASLATMSLNCPTTLAVSVSGNCSSIASYSDGSSKTVSPIWTSSNTAALMVSSSGALTGGNVIVDTPVTITASYSEGGVTQTATVQVTVKAAVAKLSGLTISGDASVKSGSSMTLTATGSYSDGSSHNVSPTWSVNSGQHCIVGPCGSVADINASGVLTTNFVTTDTPLTVTASYTENGITKTATAMVTVKASVVLPVSIVISGASLIKAGDGVSYAVTVVYGDGTTKNPTNVTWSVTGSGATVDNTGLLTALGGLTSDTTVILGASYTENGITKNAQQSVAIKAVTRASTACSGTGSNLSGITIAGSAIKKYGDSLDVSYCLKNYNSVTKFDVYIAVMLPDSTLLFMQSAGFFGTPSFTAYDSKTAPQAYLSNTLVPDKSGSVLQIPALPMELPSGTYTFYAIPIRAGKDVLSGFNWIGTLAQANVTITK